MRRIASLIFLRKLVALRFSSFLLKRERPLIHDHFPFFSACEFSPLLDFQGRIRQSAVHEESLSEREQHQYVT